MNKLRLIIVEDEAASRELLRTYLTTFSQIEIIGAFANSHEALKEVAQKSPDAVFIDIEMPDLDGLSFAARLRVLSPDIIIVFITGHTKYAADAYRLEAVDYIVKPVTRESLERTISKMEKYLSIYSQKNSSDNFDKIIVKNGSETNFINTDDIFFVEKLLRKSIFHTVDGRVETTESLNHVQNRLNKAFFRCHKSYIINLTKIKKISPIADRLYKVEFYNYPHYVTMGRQSFEEVCSIIAR